MSDIHTSAENPLRDKAITNLKRRRDLRGHVLVYLLVNSALVGVWAVTGGDSFFWPVFPLVFWGIGLVMNIWDVYLVEDPTEETIEREMRRLGERR